MHVTNADAFVWLDQTQTEPFDIAIVDFPDPNNFALGKLYTTRFYNLLKAQAEAGLCRRHSNHFAARRPQSRSGASSTRSNPSALPSGHIKRPSRALASGVMHSQNCSHSTHRQNRPTNIELHFLNDDSFASMFEFPADTSRPDGDIEINRLDNQAWSATTRPSGGGLSSDATFPSRTADYFPRSPVCSGCVREPSAPFPEGEIVGQSCGSRAHLAARAAPLKFPPDNWETKKGRDQSAAGIAGLSAAWKFRKIKLQ